MFYDSPRDRVFLIWLYITALMLAVEKENIEIVRLLLKCNKTDVNILNI